MMFSRHVGLLSQQPIERQCVTTYNASISPNIIAERRDMAMKGEVLGSSVPDKNNMRVAPGELAFTQKHATFHESTKRGNKTLNAFTSFTGISYSKGTTQERFEDEFALLGVASQAVLFEDDSNSNTGFPIQTSGSCTITNNSKSTLMPGQFVTWERPLKDVSTSSQDRADRVVASKHVGQLAPLFITDITDVFLDHARTAARGTRTNVSSKSSTTSQSDLIAAAHKRQIMKAAFDGVISAIEYGLVNIISPQMNANGTPQYLKKQGGIGALFSSQHFIGAKLDNDRKDIIDGLKKITELILYDTNNNVNNVQNIDSRTALINITYDKIEELSAGIVQRWGTNSQALAGIVTVLNTQFYDLHEQLFAEERNSPFYKTYSEFIAQIEYIIISGYYHFTTLEEADTDKEAILNDAISIYYRSCRYFLKCLTVDGVEDLNVFVLQIAREYSSIYLDDDSTPSSIHLPVGFFVLRALMGYFTVSPSSSTADKLRAFLEILFDTARLIPIIDASSVGRSDLFRLVVEWFKNKLTIPVKPNELTYTSVFKTTPLKTIEKHGVDLVILIPDDFENLNVPTISLLVDADNEAFDDKIRKMKNQENIELSEQAINRVREELTQINRESLEMIKKADIDKFLFNRQRIAPVDAKKAQTILSDTFGNAFDNLSADNKRIIVETYTRLQKNIEELNNTVFSVHTKIVNDINTSGKDDPISTLESIRKQLMDLSDRIKSYEEIITDARQELDGDEFNIQIPPYQLGIIKPVETLTKELNDEYENKGIPLSSSPPSPPPSSSSSSSSSTTIIVSGTQEHYMELSRIFGLLERTDSVHSGEYRKMTRQINARTLYGYLSDADRKRYSGINLSLFDSSKFDLPIDSLGRPKLEYVSPSTQLKQLYNSQDGSVVAYLFAEDMNRMFQRSFAMVTKTSPPSFPVNVTIR